MRPPAVTLLLALGLFTAGCRTPLIAPVDGAGDGPRVDLSVDASRDAARPLGYAAVARVSGNADLDLLKDDAALGACVRLLVSTGPVLGPLATPPGWTARLAEAYAQPWDCSERFQFGIPTLGISDALAGASGRVDFTVPPGGRVPCEVSVHATLPFEGLGGQLGFSVRYDVDRLPVAGGCR